MNGYARRAPFYRSEFAVRDDFSLLKRLLAGEDGLVVDIPSGAGRLLPVHQAHRREVIMVDIEPAMTGQCRLGAGAAGLTPRVTAVHGDITTWQVPSPAAWIVVARGGLQMLPSQKDIAQALAACAANLADGGLLYLDVAMPWTAAPAGRCHLPLFLRFTGTARLQGCSYIHAGPGTRIRRSYTSTLLPDRVAVHFQYHADGSNAVDWPDFEADASWCRVDVASVVGTLTTNRLTVISTLGDYTGTPYASGSARFICIAAAL